MNYEGLERFVYAVWGMKIKTSFEVEVDYNKI